MIAPMTSQLVPLSAARARRVPERLPHSDCVVFHNGSIIDL